MTDITMTRAAPATLNPSARTVEALVATADPVAMPPARNPNGSMTPWRERLDMKGADWTRFAVAPVLVRHGSTSVLDQVGVVDSFAVRGDALYATLRFGERPDAAAIFQDVATGALRGVSIGYTVSKYGPAEDAGDGGPPVFTAMAWQPYEVTIVAVPADPATGIRAFTPDAPAADPKDAPADPAFFRELITQARGCGLQIEESFFMTTNARSGGDDSGDTITRREARAMVFDALVNKPRPNISAAQPLRHDTNPAVMVREAMAEAVACRVTGAAPGEHAREFMGLRIHEMAREMIRDAGGTDRAFLSAPSRVIERAMHTTSDFPLLLGTASSRILAEAYKRAAPAIKRVVRIRPDVPDFRTVNIIRLAGMNRLALLNESGEIQAGTATEAGESYKVNTFARVFMMSREAMVNDDLGAMQSVFLMGGAAAETEAAELLAYITSNGGNGPTMKDGNPLFRTASNNLAAAGTGMDITNVGAAIAAMRTQTDAGGNVVAVDPAIILVGPAMELSARQLVANITPPSIGNANPYTNAFTIVVEPRLTGKQWFLFSDPAAAAVLEMAYLAGSNGGPTTETFTEATKLGLTIRVVHDFGIGAIGRAGVWRNPGA